MSIFGTIMTIIAVLWTVMMFFALQSATSIYVFVQNNLFLYIVGYLIIIVVIIVAKKAVSSM